MATHPTLLRRTDRIAALGLVVLMLATLALTAAPLVHAATTPPTVTWTGQDNLTKTNTKSVFPGAVVDSNEKLHVIYSTEDGKLWYTNNVAGSIAAPKQLDGSAGLGTEPFYALALGPGNTLHVAYARLGSDKEIYYIQGTQTTAGVTWTPRQHISQGVKSYAANLVVDSGNNAHIVWIDDSCGQYNVFYRVRRADGSLGGISAPKFDCSFQNRPQITLTSDGKPHVVFQRDREIYYARLEPTGWVNQNISNSGGTTSLNPTVTSDGTGIYVAWDENVNGHDVQFRRSVDGGQNWSEGFVPISDTSAFASFPYAAAAPNGRIFISWADKSFTNDLEIWFTEFNPQTKLFTAPKQISNQSGDSKISVVAVGKSRAEIVWDGKPGGLWQIWNSHGVVTGSECNGTLSLAGGVTAVNSTSVAGTITPDNCTPTQMQISVDTPVTDITPKQPYQASFNVTIPVSNACTHTVYARLLIDNTPGEIFSDEIMVDIDVDAIVNAWNPFLPNNVPPATPTDGQAQGGDPNYTRDGRVFLQINDNDDCTGLKEFTASGNATQPIDGESFTGYINILQGTTGQGEKPFQINVKDELNNTTTYPSAVESFTVIYDTEPPVLDMTKSPTMTTPVSVTNILTTLTFSNTEVHDNLFGPREGLPGNTEFWGVYVANSRVMTPTLSTLNWTAVQVHQPGTTFSVPQWSLFAGLASASRTAGDYYVFVKFVDGAGNVTQDVIRSQKIILADDFDLPTRYLPLVAR
jgi:hypothetical protein